ncbi:MAG: hypothetical protein KF861_12040 [Planctomycetaceae bacterium]|nr:hypothetical protein [Planctomycetaceae bacterium]
MAGFVCHERLLWGMPNWRRAFVPGGTYFFMVVTERRAPSLCDPLAWPTVIDGQQRETSLMSLNIPAIADKLDDLAPAHPIGKLQDVRTQLKK